MTDNSAQIDYWNGDAGATWAKEADALDRMLEPLGRLAIEALGPMTGERLLDIGCGAGATSRALAALGAEVTGVDISAPLLALGRSRAGGPVYLEADASAAPLPGPFDAAFSRFGVMFFADPASAFTHLHAAMKPGGRMSFVCWGPTHENSWAVEPVIAALPLLPTPPEPPIPGAPGPFAFAEAGRAQALLAQAGWSEVEARAWKGPYQVAGPDLDAGVAIMLKIGPLGPLLRDYPSAVAPVSAALRAVLAKRLTPEGVVFDASVWIVTARA